MCKFGQVLNVVCLLTVVNWFCVCECSGEVKICVVYEGQLDTAACVPVFGCLVYTSLVLKISFVCYICLYV